MHYWWLEVGKNRMAYHLGLHKFMHWFSKVCPADPKGSATSTQRIRVYISTMGTSKFTYFLNYRNGRRTSLIG